MFCIRRSLVQKVQLSLRGDVGIAPYGGLLYAYVDDIAPKGGAKGCCTKRSFTRNPLPPLNRNVSCMRGSIFPLYLLAKMR